MATLSGNQAEALDTLNLISRRVAALRAEVRRGGLPNLAADHLSASREGYLRLLDETLRRAAFDQELIVAERKVMESYPGRLMSDLIATNCLEAHAAMVPDFSDPETSVPEDYAILTFRRGVWGGEIGGLLGSLGYRAASLRELLSWTAEDRQLPHRYPCVIAFGSVGLTADGPVVPFLMPFLTRLTMHATDPAQYLHPGKYYLAAARVR